MRFSLFPKSASKEEIERDAARQIEEVISAGRPPPAEWTPGQGNGTAAAPTPAPAAGAPPAPAAPPPPPPPPAPTGEATGAEGPGPVAATPESVPDAATWDPAVEAVPIVEPDRAASRRARSNGARRPAGAGRRSS